MYKHVSTEKIIHDLSAVGLVRPEETKIIKSRSGKTTRHVARIPLNTENVLLFGSEVRPELLLWNSYAGECSFTAKLGFFRAVCANGMALGEVFESVKLRHVEGPKFNTEFSNFFDGIEDLSKKIYQVEEVASKRLTENQQKDIVNILGFSDRMSKEIVRQIESPIRREDNIENVWSLWNTINEAMKRNSRSPLAFEMKNNNLLSRILEASEQVAA